VDEVFPTCSDAIDFDVQDDIIIMSDADERRASEWSIPFDDIP